MSWSDFTDWRFVGFCIASAVLICSVVWAIGRDHADDIDFD